MVTGSAGLAMVLLLPAHNLAEHQASDVFVDARVAPHEPPLAQRHLRISIFPLSRLSFCAPRSGRTNGATFNTVGGSGSSLIHSKRFPTRTTFVMSDGRSCHSPSV